MKMIFRKSIRIVKGTYNLTLDETRHERVERGHRSVTLLRQGILDNV